MKILIIIFLLIVSASANAVYFFSASDKSGITFCTESYRDRDSIQEKFDEISLPPCERTDDVEGTTLLICNPDGYKKMVYIASNYRTCSSIRDSIKKLVQ